MRKVKISGGFTIIELMVVIVIISILVLVTVWNVAKSRAEANLSACVQNLKTIATAIEMAQIDHPEWFKGKHNAVYRIDEKCNIVKYGYLKSVTKCPSSGCYYGYRVGDSMHEGIAYDDYWHVAHHNYKNSHNLFCGVKDYYPYYRGDRGICYDDHDSGLK